MKMIVSAALAVVGLSVTACQPVGDPVCAISDGFGLSSDARSATTARAITLTASVCTNTPAPPVEFYDGSTKVGTLATPSGNRSDGLNTFDLYGFSPSFTKAQNGSHVYTAKIALRGTVLTTDAVTVTVNIP